jgi:UDP-N-acetylmuramate dehydrogenase
MKAVLNTQQKETLQNLLGQGFEVQAPMSKYTTAHAGGPAEAVCIVKNSDDLEKICTLLWQWQVPFRIFGKGSNILVSDTGIREVVIINRSNNIEFSEDEQSPSVKAESGVNLSGLARQAAEKGFSGLEWAVSVPGTVGGAIFGNAGAHGSDIEDNLKLAEILHPIYGKKVYHTADLQYMYRSSVFKRTNEPVVILNALFKLQKSTRQEVEERMASFANHRKNTQPPGANLGSMFKNPEGESAGALIEAAGLKGTRIGGAGISSKHANFFLNKENASAADIYQLIQLAKSTVKQEFNRDLELEIELIGEWDVPVSAALEN